MSIKNIFVVTFLTYITSSAFAVTESPKGKITGYYTGWAKDQVRVTIEGANYTEGNCQFKDGYVTAELDNTGYKTHVSALLAAYMSGKSVSITVEGCIEGRPRIWAVSIN
jgi:hypothetical protein